MKNLLVISIVFAITSVSCNSQHSSKNGDMFFGESGCKIWLLYDIDNSLVEWTSWVICFDSLNSYCSYAILANSKFKKRSRSTDAISHILQEGQWVVIGDSLTFFPEGYKNKHVTVYIESYEKDTVNIISPTGLDEPMMQRLISIDEITSKNCDCRNLSLVIQNICCSMRFQTV